MSHWRHLLERMLGGLSKLKAAGHPTPEWVLGGGTALMIQTGHRLSEDIDVFITDPQYLGYLSPDLAGEDIWRCRSFDSAAHYLKLIYTEGEIDFIVAPALTNTLYEKRVIAGATIPLEHPVEIAVKKLHYRGAQLKIRDIFDIAVVDHLHSELLAKNLQFVANRKSAVLNRLASIEPEFARFELAKLAIAPQWRWLAPTCIERVRAIISRIP